MEQILQSYDFTKYCYRYNDILQNTKAMFRSRDSDIDFFDIVTGVLQEDTLAPFQLTNCLQYVLRTSIDLIK